MTDYKTENDKFAKYKKKINEPLMTDEQARARLKTIEQFVSDGFFPLIINGEMHPHIYTK